MTNYAEIRVSTVASRNSDLTDPLSQPKIASDAFEYDKYAEIQGIATQTIDLAWFTTVTRVVITNAHATGTITVDYTNASTASKLNVPAAATTVMGTVTVADDLVITPSNSPTGDYLVQIYGT